MSAILDPAQALRDLGFRGRLVPDAPLAARTWFRVGGAADLLAQPEDEADLATLLRAGVAPQILGACSNLIVRDGGIGGVTLRLGGAFGAITRDGDGLIAGAAALDRVVAEHAAEWGLGGLAFLAGIPGSVGGGVVMNAGAHGGDFAGVLDWAEIVTQDGALLRLPVERLGLSYRTSRLPDGCVVVRARLRGTPASPEAIRAEIRDVLERREATQPVRARTGGSTFRNPDDHSAWSLIDRAGCRGLIRGGAQVSEKHCNFLLNLGTATAADLEGLGEDVRARVRAMSGIDLHWEIKRLGRAA